MVIESWGSCSYTLLVGSCCLATGGGGEKSQKLTVVVLVNRTCHILLDTHVFILCLLN